MTAFNPNAILDFYAFDGEKYYTPEKAPGRETEMLAFKAAGQAAREEFVKIGKGLAERVPSFAMERVSAWMTQAQIARCNFWVYYREPGKSMSSVSIAIRLYNDLPEVGIALEVSMLERKKDADSLLKQRKVLDVPIVSPLYYSPQHECEPTRVDGTEQNRLELATRVDAGEIRKVLVKYDVPNIARFTEVTALVDELEQGFNLLLPYYLAAQ